MASGNDNRILIQEACQTGQALEYCDNYSPAPSYEFLIGGAGVVIAIAALAAMIIRLVRKKRRLAMDAIRREARPELMSTAKQLVSEKQFKLPVTALLIIVMILGTGISTYATVRHNNRDADQSEQSFFARSNPTTYDESLSDILPTQPVSMGDIPQFVEKLRQARNSRDTSICDSLPKPQQQDFFFDDFSLSSPTGREWATYCKALVKNDPVICKSIQGYGHPNLQRACLTVLEKEV